MPNIVPMSQISDRFSYTPICTFYYMADGNYLERDYPKNIFRVNGVQVFPAVWQWYYEGRL